MTRVRVGVVGCGAISAGYRLPALREIAEVDITAVVDADSDRARQTAEQFVIGSHLHDYRQLFGRVDAAIVATPNSTHCPISCDLMKHGIHVLCEKPMAVTTAQCSEMIEARDEGGVKFMVGHTLRFQQVLQDVKRLLDMGCLGKITSIETRCGGHFNWPARTGFYFDKQLAGGGVIMDMGCHLFDLAGWLLGEGLRVVSVRTGEGKHKDIEEEADISLVSTTGVQVKIALSRKMYLGNSLRIEGEKGYLWCNVYKKGLQINSRGLRMCERLGEVMIQQPTKGSPFMHEMTHFVQCVLNGALPTTSGESSSKVVGLVEDCYRLMGT